MRVTRRAVENGYKLPPGYRLSYKEDYNWVEVYHKYPLNLIARARKYITFNIVFHFIARCYFEQTGHQTFAYPCLNPFLPDGYLNNLRLCIRDDIKEALGDL